MLGVLKVMKGRLWLMGISPHGGLVGQPGVGSSTGVFEIWLKGALGVECLSLSLSLSLWELCEGNLEDMQKRLWRQATLSLGAQFGEPGGGLIYREL